MFKQVIMTAYIDIFNKTSSLMFLHIMSTHIHATHGKNMGKFN